MQITGETYKHRGDYRLAGQMDCLQGKAAYYGCHFGMRSTYRAAIAAYNVGWQEIDNLFHNQAKD